MKKNVFDLLILLLILYLFISAIYVFIHIDFGTPPGVVGMGYSESTNIIRFIMGLPRTVTTYEGVPPIYLIEVIVKMFLGVGLSVFLYKTRKKFTC